MDLEKSFLAPRSPRTLAPLVQGFFKAAGYRQVSEKPLVYRRGSRLGTWMSFAPRRWLVRAAVDLRSVRADQTEVVARLYVNDAGQAVTDAEREYWDTELTALERALITGTTDAPALERAGRAVASAGLRTVMVMVAGATVLFVVTYFLSYALKRFFPILAA